MAIIVQKYGGSSLATTDHIRQVARKVVRTRRTGHDVVAVVSAMGGTTDQLMALANGAASDPCRRELDMLLSTGELVSMALLSMAIQDLGEPAVSLTGAACGIVTNGIHFNARILEIRPHRIHQELRQGKVVVVAGFQGMSRESEVTTLGRGGSDTTAVALAAALGAERCEIFSDVEGVYTADPRIVTGVQKLEVVPFETMEEFAWHGAKVLKAEAVEFARDNDVAVLVGSTFGTGPGTRIEPADLEEDAFRPRRGAVSGVSGRKDLIRISVDTARVNGSDPEEVLDRVADYDLIFSDIDQQSDRWEIFLSGAEIPNIEAFGEDLQTQFPNAVGVSQILGGVSLVGFGLGSRPAALLAAIRALEARGIEVYRGFTGRESLTLVMPTAKVDEAIRTLHRQFILETPQAAQVALGCA